MKKLKRHRFWLMVIVGLTAPAFAQQKSIKLPADDSLSQLKPGSGQETVRNNCFTCHSTDYIVRQPRLDAAHWDAEVKKMIDVFGARINASDAKMIADYLAKNYGSEPSAGKQKAEAGKR